MTKITETLIRLRACAKSLAWLALPENEEKPPADLWDTCPRGDWLLWLAAKAGVNRNLVTLAACDCARLALPYVPDGENRPRICIEAAEAFTRGEATVDVVRAAAASSLAANDTAYSAAYAAYSAALSTDANYYASRVADFAGESAASASRTVAYVACDFQYTFVETLAECANIVRSRIPWSVINTAFGMACMIGYNVGLRRAGL